jgi:hypothetical protein
MEFIPVHLRSKIDDKLFPPCWIWIGAKDKNGTPRINKKTYGTSMGKQYIYCLSGKDVINGRELLHSCSRQDCINPNHLTYEWTRQMLHHDFMTHVEQTDNCWLWNGCKDSGGYGRLSKDKYSESMAHRFSYSFYNTAIDISNVELRHSCPNHNCVNPNHLSPGIIGSWNVANMNDALDKKALHNQKFTRQQVKEIRARIVAGARTKDLITELRCSKVAIADLKYNRTWYDPDYIPPH